jgi:hypothetical protein
MQMLNRKTALGIRSLIESSDIDRNDFRVEGVIEQRFAKTEGGH